MMNWDDIEIILCNGSKEEILNIRCPNCLDYIEFEFFIKSNALTYKCTECGVIIKGHGYMQVPNCVEYFGIKATIK